MVCIVLSRIKLGILTNGRLDGLSDEGREEMLQLLLDGATIDNRNNVNLILSIPTEDVVSNAGTEPSSFFSNRQKKGTVLMGSRFGCNWS